ncbi:MAG: hypothetical protein DIU70_005125 [Bacillota bacterium]
MRKLAAAVLLVLGTLLVAGTAVAAPPARVQSGPIIRGGGF